MGTKAALNVTGDPFEANIHTDMVAVQITEAGEPVGVKELPDGDTSGTIFTNVPSKFEPGMTYPAEVGVTNTGEADAYVRVVVRKYWLKTTEENTTEKGLSLSPSYIEPIVASKWKAVADANNGEETETVIYYYQGKLGTEGEAASADLFTGIRINEAVLTNGRVTTNTTKHEGVTVINYVYEYDGLTFVVEAEAQAVQTHNAELAIKSVWGVDSSVVGL